jgi:hypothetical protein
VEDYTFDDVVALHAGPDFVPRPWLTARVEAALDDPASRYVLLTAEPGAGKTGFAAHLAASHPTWARYFIRRDSATTLTGGDARSFLLAVGHQLAWHHPELFRPELLDIEVRQQVDEVLAGGRTVGVRIDDLTVSPFYRTAALRLDQSVGGLAGDLVGVEVGRATLDPRLLEVANLAHLALIAPAVALASRDPQARLVVLVDALDEIADHIGFDGLLSWLESGPQLPANVRLVLTSRAHSKLELFRRRRVGEVVELTIDAAAPEVRADLMAYAGRLVGEDAVAAAIRAQGGAPQDVAEEATDRAEGNFAYLVAYSRALTEAIARLDDEFRDRLLRFADVPMGLDSLYGLFMEQIRNDVSRMGLMAVAEPVNPQDTLCPAWEAVGQPLLGVLVVAREALTLDQLMRLSQVRVWRRDAANVVARLGQFLDGSGASLRLFHGSLVEFLVSPAVRDRYPQWAVEPAEWHERIVLSYRGAAASLAGVDWAKTDDYGLRHLPVHVTRSRPRVADQVVELVTPRLRRAMKDRFGGDGDFLALTDLAAGHAVTAMPPARAVPVVFEIGAAVQYLRQAGPQLPPSVLGALAASGRSADALDRIAELADPMTRVRALDTVLRRAPADQWPDAARHVLLRQLTDDARAVVPAQGQDPATVRQGALAVAAEAWAAVDHARALRLAESGGCGAATIDAIHIAAAKACAAPDEAAALLARVRGGRAEAFLDLVERFGASAALVSAAEQGLAGELPPGRLRAYARLAGVWQPVDPARAAWYVQAIAAEADRAVATELVRTTPDGAKEVIALLAAVAQAALTVAAIQPVAATAMLNRLEQVGMNGLTRDALWGAARAWLRLGDLASARRVLDRFVQPALGRSWQGAPDLAEAAALITGADPQEGQRLADAAFAAIDKAPPAEDMIAGILVQSAHATVARSLFAAQPDRAIDVAWRMSSELGRGSRAAGLADRLTVLGDLAQRLHDAGNPEAADELLAECLADGGTGPDAVDDVELPYRRVPDGGPGNAHHTTGQVWGAYGFNIIEQWRRRCEDQVLTRPAGIVRAVLPGADSIGSPYGWDRAVRVLAVACGSGAWNHVAKIPDRAERGIGIAVISRTVKDEGADAEAADLSELAVKVISSVPQYAWKAPMAEVDPDGVADHLLPDQRARFEAALAHAIDDAAVVNPLAYRVLRAEEMLRYAEDVARHESTAEVVHLLHKLTGEVLAWPSAQLSERLLAGVTAAGLIAAERAVRGRAGPLPVPPLAVPSQLYGALADLWTLQYGLPVRDRLLHSLTSLLEAPQPAAAAHLAAMAVPFVGDPSALMAAVTDALGRVSRGTSRARVLLTLADATRPADPDGAEALLDQALAIAEQHLYPGEYGELTRLLYPHVVAHRPALAAAWLLDAFRDRWREAMSLLDAAAPELVALCGPDLVTDLITAHDRARAFGAAALSPVVSP